MPISPITETADIVNVFSTHYISGKESDSLEYEVMIHRMTATGTHGNIMAVHQSQFLPGRFQLGLAENFPFSKHRQHLSPLS